MVHLQMRGFGRGKDDLIFAVSYSVYVRGWQPDFNVLINELKADFAKYGVERFVIELSVPQPTSQERESSETVLAANVG